MALRMKAGANLERLDNPERRNSRPIPQKQNQRKVRKLALPGWQLQIKSARSGGAVAGANKTEAGETGKEQDTHGADGTQE
jgi:hypothetical protein